MTVFSFKLMYLEKENCNFFTITHFKKNNNFIAITSTMLLLNETSINVTN